jgi:hypothetical protein
MTEIVEKSKTEIAKLTAVSRRLQAIVADLRAQVWEAEAKWYELGADPSQKEQLMLYCTNLRKQASAQCVRIKELIAEGAK